MKPGAYRFTATSDDGIRLYVDGRLVIDQWSDHPARTFTGYLRLTAGPHEIWVEYYENTGRAMVHVSWEVVPPESWTGEYYDNRWLQGPPRLTRHDVGIDFDWGYGSPAPGIPNDGFSVRWIRTVSFREGLYRFTTTTDDGVRLWVNGHLLIDQWRDQPPTSYSGTIHLAGGVPIVMEYYENGGAASARLDLDARRRRSAPAITRHDHRGRHRPGLCHGWKGERLAHGCRGARRAPDMDAEHVIKWYLSYINTSFRD